jgi:uncharacterized protein with HEPN domain
MRDYALRVERMVAGASFDDFSPESMLRLAVERAIELVGEAATRVSTEFREQNPQIPWRAIIGQRVILAHRYGDIDGPILWQTATVEVPRLIGILNSLLNADDLRR